MSHLKDDRFSSTRVPWQGPPDEGDTGRPRQSKDGTTTCPSNTWKGGRAAVEREEPRPSSEAGMPRGNPSATPRP